LNQTKLLITGSNGFIGKFVLAELASKAKHEFEVITWDVSEMGSFLTKNSRNRVLNRVKPDRVLHLAWADTSAVDYDLNPLHSVWASESIEFMKECERHQIWFVGVGSAIDDQISGRIGSSYINSKIQLRREFEKYTSSELRTFVRPQYVISVDRTRPRVLALSTSEEGVNVNRIREPEKKLDFIDVRDLASGIVQVLRQKVTGTVELGSGRFHTISDLIEAVKKERLGTLELLYDKKCSKSPFGPLQILNQNWEPQNTFKLFGCVPD
jgi:nucleoside-diphosphate-sugar epimerase